MSNSDEHEWCVVFNDTATTEIYTLSLHDALPISAPEPRDAAWWLLLLLIAALTVVLVALLGGKDRTAGGYLPPVVADRKSTRLNSSHANISYAVFCLKKKTMITISHPLPPITPLF